ncbi:hypothetical protein LTR50_000794 [Elasticomyces elasticus]|nr:hypothetical protein LTR50_000794 [Elasticomyces elasticus]
MASLTTPSTPKAAPQVQHPGVRRSFTVPPKLSSATRAAPPVEIIGAAESIETLYVHPTAKVVSFSTASASSRPSSSTGRATGNNGGTDTTGSLPWASTTEMTLAAGPLEIYRVPGSVSFLHSGDLLHAILPRSQCWCVDDVSKFVFRVRADQYYRIELPGETEEDKARVEDIKAIFQKVLQYEKTACPFERSFTVDLPEAPKTPTRRKARFSTARPKRWTLDRVWRPEGEHEELNTMGVSESSSAETEGSDEDDGIRRRSRVLAEDPTVTMDATAGASAEPLELKTPIRPKALAPLRSVTAPPQFPFRSKTPSRNVVHDGRSLQDQTDNASLSSSVDSFHSISGTIDFPPSPPQSGAGSPSPAAVETMSDTSNSQQGRTYCRDTSEATAGPPLSVLPVEPKSYSAAGELPPTGISSSTTPGYGTIRPSTPTCVSDCEEQFDFCWCDVETPETIRPSKQRSNSSHRAPSLLPPTADLFTAGHGKASKRQQQLTTALARKTYAIFLGPPAHLAALMLRIAARIANGGLFTTIESPKHSRRRVPGSWDMSEEEDEWGEDDYGVPLGNSVALASRRRNIRRSWEVD